MPGVEKPNISQKTMLKVIIGLTVAVLVVVFAGFVYMNARRLGWTLGWIYVGSSVGPGTGIPFAFPPNAVPGGRRRAAPPPLE